jgi:DNA-binding NtrC family response regulator
MGVELAKGIFTLRPDMPIIMCTGFCQLVDADKARAAGIKAFAMKPLTKKELAKTIRNVLDEEGSGCSFRTVIDGVYQCAIPTL